MQHCADKTGVIALSVARGQRTFLRAGRDDPMQLWELKSSL
jgi:hypothetical protein